MNTPNHREDIFSLVVEDSLETSVNQVLRTNGLLFDPFSILEASADAHLSSYFIDHEAFSMAWGDWNSIIFAPAGGGKTALRAKVTQSCWVGQETNRPFPITYIPPYIKPGYVTPAGEKHIEAIAQSGAAYLLLALTHRPHWFFRLSETGKSLVRRALAWNLPGPVSRYLRPCQTKNSLDPLRAKFSPIELPPDPPNAVTLSEIFYALDPGTINEERPGILESWNILQDVLLNVLRFPSIYIQMDGLDATREMAEQPQLTAFFLSSLVQFLYSWSACHTYLKIYIPVETKEYLQNYLPAIIEHSQITTIEWTPPLLAEMVRRRIYVASQGAYGSLGPLSSPEIRDPEIDLAKSVYPLPREMLVLIRRVFAQIAARDDPNPRITNNDIDLAKTWYLAETPYKATNVD